MRGKQSFRQKLGFIHRITPADAGKTQILFFKVIRLTDHPRGCGENTIFSAIRYFIIGSPPRMRGKLRFTVKLGFTVRITPADAGKTACT